MCTSSANKMYKRLVVVVSEDVDGKDMWVSDGDGSGFVVGGYIVMRVVAVLSCSRWACGKEC